MVLEAEAANGIRITTFEEPLDYNALEGTGLTSESDLEADTWERSYRPRRAPYPRKTPEQRREEMRDAAAAAPSQSSHFSYQPRSYDNSAWSSSQQHSWYMGDGRGLAVVCGNDGVASFPTKSQNCQHTADHHVPLPTHTNHTTYYPPRFTTL